MSTDSSAAQPMGRVAVEMDWHEGRPVVYVAMIEYEGGFAAFSTLDRAIAVAGPYCDYIEAWELDPDPAFLFALPRRIVWHKSDEQRAADRGES